jgi:hypothetical protein
MVRRKFRWIGIKAIIMRRSFDSMPLSGCFLQRSEGEVSSPLKTEYAHISHPISITQQYPWPPVG